MKRRISKYACCLTIIILISIISSQISFSQILLSMAEMDAIIGTLSESDQEQFIPPGCLLDVDIYEFFHKKISLA